MLVATIQFMHCYASVTIQQVSMATTSNLHAQYHLLVAIVEIDSFRCSHRIAILLSYSFARLLYSYLYLIENDENISVDAKIFAMKLGDE